jgi:glycosyltransferase involved in cell wall biosynthesis
MKVLYVNTLYPPDVGGGAEVVLAGIVQGFRDRGQDASVLTTHGGAGVLREWVGNVPVYRLGQKNIYWHFPPRQRPAWARTVWHAIDSYNLPMARQAATLIDELGPDLIVGHNLAGLSVAVWGQAEKRGIPFVQVLHDYYTLCPKVTMFRQGRPCTAPCGSCRAFRLPHARASRAVSAVIGVSQAVLDTHLRSGLFAQASIQAVVHNARSMALARQAAVERDASRPFTFGYIGGLTDIKGVRLLMQAFDRVAATASRPMQLLLAGRGKAEDVAELKRAHGSASVHFLGHVDAADFYRRIDVCVVPSLWNEPLGMVVFEAIASGVPVIGSRRGGIPEMIRDGVNGLLFDPTEAGALEALLTRVVDSPSLLESLRDGGRASVRHFLEPQRMLDEYEAIYRRLVPGAAVAAAGATGAVPPATRVLPAAMAQVGQE